jgi:hypothetical protein
VAFQPIEVEADDLAAVVDSVDRGLYDTGHVYKLEATPLLDEAMCEPTGVEIEPIDLAHVVQAQRLCLSNQERPTWSIRPRLEQSHG